MRIRKFTRRYMAAPLFALAVAACYPSHYRTAPGVPDAELAKIRIHPAVKLLSIDGESPAVPVGVSPVAWDDFFITPGGHVLEVLYFVYDERTVTSSEETRPIKVDLRPGQIVSICPGAKRNRLNRVVAWDPYVAEFPKFDPDSRWWMARFNRPKVPPECL